MAINVWLCLNQNNSVVILKKLCQHVVRRPVGTAADCKSPSDRLRCIYLGHDVEG